MSAQGLLPARSSATATGVALGGSSRVVSPVARRLSRSSSIATTPATGSSSRITTGVAPAAAIILALRLGAASTTVSVVGAVGALDTAPVLGLVALLGLVTHDVAVAALHDARLVAVLGDVALVTAVVASTTSTAAASTSTGLGAVGLVVADNTLVKLKGMRDSIERDG
jgi:hypothetical protein